MSTERDPDTDQAAPKPATRHDQSAHLIAIWSIITENGHDYPINVIEHAIDLIADRMALGAKKYATILHANNGRSHTQDLLEELADAVAYAHCTGNPDLVRIAETALLDTIAAAD
jgi:hypothetical protein